MCRSIVIILFLSLMVFILNAQWIELSTEEIQQRQAELQRQADRFKQETGFEGEIQIEHHNMTLYEFSGNFQNLSYNITESADTLEVRQIFEEVIERMIHHLPVSRDQLENKRIRRGNVGVGTDYIQKVNGYEIENAKYLKISYDYQENMLRIRNRLVFIDPTPVTPLITEEQARRLFEQNASIMRYRSIGKPVSVRFNLMYCYEREEDSELPVMPRRYKLAWHTLTFRQQFIVDAVTGKIMSNIDRGGSY